MFFFIIKTIFLFNILSPYETKLRQKCLFLNYCIFSSPIGELIGYPWIRRPSSSGRRPSSVHIFKHLLLRNRLANQSQILCGASWEGGTKVCINGPGHMTKMAAMPINGKNLKKSSSPEPAGRFPRNLVCSIGDSCLS